MAKYLKCKICGSSVALVKPHSWNKLKKPTWLCVFKGCPGKPAPPPTREMQLVEAIRFLLGDSIHDGAVIDCLKCELVKKIKKLIGEEC